MLYGVRELGLLGGCPGALWSPVLHVDTAGRLVLFYCESTECLRGPIGHVPARYNPGGAIMMTWTKDVEEWSEPSIVMPHADPPPTVPFKKNYTITPGWGIPKVLANKMIVLATGEWVLPYWREKPKLKSILEGRCQCAGTKAYAGVLISEDQGAQWSAYGEITHSLTWLIENSVVQLGSGQLMMFFRTYAGQVFASSSEDRGRTWAAAVPYGIPNPDSKLAAISVDTGLEGLASRAIVMAFNDHPKYHEDGFTRFRASLRIAVSMDEGSSWTRLAQVDEMEPAKYGWQYHYPTIMQDGCNILEESRLSSSLYNYIKWHI
ncbi:hypothetical protein CYMTET_23545 [Cymbomonas tetramitiformis]|uniref:Sialidase domain-containing protein n=1 Tax=Cymbomonas tetramitiformis TaxID=36881 RepID=A0AAE0FY38_9CHLO|nr:hypothetical protein CYMTET_23545 [Cymbomonas tetramitiformis]